MYHVSFIIYHSSSFIILHLHMMGKSSSAHCLLPIPTHLQELDNSVEKATELRKAERSSERMLDHVGPLAPHLKITEQYGTTMGSLFQFF
jgi:hypothetical protein